MQTACGCWLDEAKQNAAKSAALHSPYQPKQPNAVLTVPCQGTCAIPGYDCTEGLCQPQGPYRTKLDGALTSARDIGLDVLSDQLKDGLIKAIGLAGEGLAGMLTVARESPYAHLTSLFDATPTLSFVDIHNEAVRNVNGRLTDLKREVYRYYNSTDAGQKALIKPTIRNVAIKLRELLGLMNESAQAVVREKSLGKYACYNVFEFQNATLNADFARILAVLPQ